MHGVIGPLQGAGIDTALGTGHLPSLAQLAVALLTPSCQAEVAWQDAIATKTRSVNAAVDLHVSFHRQQTLSLHIGAHLGERIARPGVTVAPPDNVIHVAHLRTDL